MDYDIFWIQDCKKEGWRQKIKVSCKPNLDKPNRVLGGSQPSLTGYGIMVDVNNNNNKNNINHQIIFF